MQYGTQGATTGRSTSNQLIADNLAALQQAVDLLERLDDT